MDFFQSFKTAALAYLHQLLSEGLEKLAIIGLRPAIDLIEQDSIKMRILDFSLDIRISLQRINVSGQSVLREVKIIQFDDERFLRLIYDLLCQMVGSRFISIFPIPITPSKTKRGVEHLLFAVEHHNRAFIGLTARHETVDISLIMYQAASAGFAKNLETLISMERDQFANIL